MPALKTQLDPRSAEFGTNAAAMRALVDDLRARCAEVAQGGGQAARDKHLARGKLLPRARVQALLDTGTPFLELAPPARRPARLRRSGRANRPPARAWRRRWPQIRRSGDRAGLST